MLTATFSEALRRCAPERILYDRLEPRDGDKGFAVPAARFDVKLPGPRKLWCFGAGKAAAKMAEGVVAKLGDQLLGGVIVAPGDGPARIGPLEVAYGDHPDPTQRSVQATDRLIEVTSRCAPDDHVLFVLSGGASSLLVRPAEGVAFADKVARVRRLRDSGAPIREINELRKQLSEVKGGKLARRFACPVTVLVFSDVPGNAFATIGSGPLHSEGGPRHVLLADGRTLARAAALEADARGVRAELQEGPVEDDVTVLAARYADLIRERLRSRREGLAIFHGEPVLRVSGAGRGGRSQHLALLVASKLRGAGGWRFLACGSDGIDGASDAAGAVVDGETWSRAHRQGLRPDEALGSFDSYEPLKAAGALIITGPTGNNLGDLHMISTDLP